MNQFLCASLFPYLIMVVVDMMYDAESIVVTIFYVVGSKENMNASNPSEYPPTGVRLQGKIPTGWRCVRCRSLKVLSVVQRKWFSRIIDQSMRAGLFKVQCVEKNKPHTGRGEQTYQFSLQCSSGSFLTRGLHLDLCRGNI